MNNSDIQSFLQEWDSTVSASQSKSYSDFDSRRFFLKQIVTLSSVAAFPQIVLANTGKLDTPFWRTLAAVQLHMFPSAINEPDAMSINATAFLKSVIELPGVDPGDKKFILDGVGWLNGLANKIYQKDFVFLDSDKKEEILRTVEKSKAGENWLALILLYLMEALLTDPVYGGNVNSAGWKWLHHQPGFPRPPANKRYFKL